MISHFWSVTGRLIEYLEPPEETFRDTSQLMFTCSLRPLEWLAFIQQEELVVQQNRHLEKLLPKTVNRSRTRGAAGSHRWSWEAKRLVSMQSPSAEALLDECCNDNSAAAAHVLLHRLWLSSLVVAISRVVWCWFLSQTCIFPHNYLSLRKTWHTSCPCSICCTLFPMLCICVKMSFWR